MTCGGEMTPRHGANAEVLAQRSLQCLSCGSTEQTLVFRQGATEINVLPPDSSRAPRSEAITSARAWKHAVEKLRSRQADIRVRTHKEKPDWHARFNQAWEKLAPPSRGPATSNANLRAPEQSVWKSARALRAELRAALASDAAARPEIKPPPEVLEHFNQFWDGLLPGRDRRAPPPEAASTQPLPPSLSLVLREHPQGASTAARAIMLLRGANVPG